MAICFARSCAGAILFFFTGHTISLVAPIQQFPSETQANIASAHDASPRQSLNESNIYVVLDAPPWVAQGVEPPRSLTDSNTQDELQIGPSLVPISMQPNGGYGKHSASQLAYLGMMASGIMAELRENAVILDLGCADGYNSIPMIKQIRTVIHNYNMVFVDLPSNDWGTAREVLSPHLKSVFPQDGASSYEDFHGMQLDDSIGAKGTLLAKSFYDRLAPDNSVDVVISGTSLQYLSPDGPDGKIIHAAGDWANFLRKRARELKPGGTLHITALHTEKQGQNLGPIWDLVNKVLKESVELGLLTEEAQSKWVWPGYSRTTGEFLLPFALGQLPDLKVESMNNIRLESPYWQFAGADPEKFVELYVPSVMAWISPYMKDTLPLEVVEFLEAKLYAEVMSNPQKWIHDFDQVIMIIRKNPILPFFR